MKYYRAKTPLPDYNIVLDSKYPAVVAEKGTGALRVFFPVEQADGATHRRLSPWPALRLPIPSRRTPPPSSRAATWPRWPQS